MKKEGMIKNAQRRPDATHARALASTTMMMMMMMMMTVMSRRRGCAMVRHDRQWYDHDYEGKQERPRNHAHVARLRPAGSVVMPISLW